MLASSHFDHLCIRLHNSNFRPIVWLWKPFHRHFQPFFSSCTPQDYSGNVSHCGFWGWHTLHGRLWNHCRDVQGWKHQWYSCLQNGFCIFLHPKDINYCSFLIHITARAHHIKLFFFATASCSYVWCYKTK